jgi:hypothetical protein
MPQICLCTLDMQEHQQQLQFVCTHMPRRCPSQTAPLMCQPPTSGWWCSSARAWCSRSS